MAKPSIERPAAGEFNAFYARYIERVPAGDLMDILAQQIDGTVAPLRQLGEERARYAYAPDKWTIAEVVGHMCDTERVMSVRALRIARGDETPLPGFDENAYTPAGDFGARSLASLLDEFVAVRHATVALFANLPDAAWTRMGRASDSAVSVRALACIIAGHELHHRGLLETRYGVASVSAGTAG